NDHAVTVLEQLLLFRFHGSGRSRGRLWFALRYIFVQAITRLRILLRLLPQQFGVFRVTLEQHLEARLLLQIVLDFARGGAGIEYQRVFTGEGTLGIVAIEQPLTRIDGDFLV